MIGKTFTRTEHGTTIRRQVLEESIQYGRRLYNLKDPDTGRTMEADADQFDDRFKVRVNTPFVQRKGYKGKSIISKQRAWK
jgi:hypothetical protein